MQLDSNYMAASCTKDTVIAGHMQLCSAVPKRKLHISFRYVLLWQDHTRARSETECARRRTLPSRSKFKSKAKAPKAYEQNKRKVNSNRKSCLCWRSLRLVLVDWLALIGTAARHVALGAELEGVARHVLSCTVQGGQRGKYGGGLGKESRFY